MPRRKSWRISKSRRAVSARRVRNEETDEGQENVTRGTSDLQGVTTTNKTLSPVSVQAPRPASVHAPRPASVHAPRPASVQAPRPASVQAPRPASVQAQSPVSLQANKSKLQKFHEKGSTNKNITQFQSSDLIPRNSGETNALCSELVLC